MSALTKRRRQLRAVLPMVALLAVTAVAAMLIPPPNPVARAQGDTCHYAQTPGNLQDITFKQEQITTWEVDKSNTFTMGGPYMGRVSVSAAPGVELRQSQGAKCGAGSQSLTVQKSSGSTQLHVRRCSAGQTHISFRTVMLDGCSGQTSTSFTWGWAPAEQTQNSEEHRQQQHQIQMEDTEGDTCLDQARRAVPPDSGAQQTEQGDNSDQIVITDLENIPEERTQQTLHAWNKARQQDGRTRVNFFVTGDGRYLTRDEAEAEFGPPEPGTPAEPLPVPDDLETIPANRTMETLAGWNRARHAAGMLRTGFNKTNDGRFLTVRETREQLGEQRQDETNFEWGQRLGFRWAPVASGYGKTPAEIAAERSKETQHEWTNRVGLTWDSAASGYRPTQEQREAEARSETALEYHKRIGAKFIGWENDDPQSGAALFLTITGATVTYTELYSQYGYPLTDKTNHPFYIALQAGLYALWAI